MSDKKNVKKICIISAVIIVILGILSSIFIFKPFFDKKNSAIAKEIAMYSKNRDKFDYTRKISYENVETKDVIKGQKLYLYNKEYEQYQSNILMLLTKKINQLSVKDANIKETTEYLDIKYSDDKQITNEYTMYNNIKLKHIDNMYENNKLDKKYITTSNIFVLGEKDGYTYTKEVIDFIDIETKTIKAVAEFDAKYNHKEDKLEYANISLLDAESVILFNKVLDKSINEYDKVTTSREDILNSLTKLRPNTKFTTYIYDTNTLVVRGSKDNIDENFKYDIQEKLIMN